MQNIEVPYLVVGGGPVGMLAAILLAGQGRRSVVLERRSGPQTAPAAHVVNARSFEICRQAGLDMGAIARLAKDPSDAGHVIFMTHLGGEEARWRPAVNVPLPREARVVCDSKSLQCFGLLPRVRR